jgi:hypothetical protein
MPPLPTEYAGTFRYVFLLFKQSGKSSADEIIKTLKSGEFEKKQPQDVAKEDSARVIEQRNNMRKLANEYEYEYIDQQLNQRHEFITNYTEGVDKFPIKHSDYRPPKPEKAITDPIELSKRRKFDIEKLVGQDLPIGACFFRTEYDICVSEEYQKHGWEEPFYIPPDLMHQNMLEQHKIYMGKSLRKQNAILNQWS